MWVSHIVYLMWNITNDVVNQECNSGNSHFHIENSSIAYNWHSIDRVQIKFHQNYKTEIFFLFLFVANFDQYFSFPTIFFHFFNQKNWDKIRIFIYFLGGNKTNFPILLEIFANFLISQNFKRAKIHPFTTTFFYLHTLINSTLLYSNWKKAFLLARDILFSFQNKRIQFTWEKNCNYYYLPMLCFGFFFLLGKIHQHPPSPSPQWFGVQTNKPRSLLRKMYNMGPQNNDKQEYDFKAQNVLSPCRLISQCIWHKIYTDCDLQQHKTPHL